MLPYEHPKYLKSKLEGKINRHDRENTHAPGRYRLIRRRNESEIIIVINIEIRL